MTPAQRKYDQDLAASLRRMGLAMFTRSRKISDALKQAAERIEALSAVAPVDPAPKLDQHGMLIQPASRPDQPTQV